MSATDVEVKPLSFVGSISYVYGNLRASLFRVHGIMVATVFATRAIITAG